jgi:SAM-dependent methyltransferase
LKLINHIRYFWYVATNWGLHIGLFTLWHEIRGERKYAINTTSFSRLSKYSLAGNSLKHATEYMPVNYLILEQLLQHLPAEAKKGGFLDIGCGAGRVACVAAHYGFTNITGIDFAKELVEKAKQNASFTSLQFTGATIHICWQNILDYEIPADTGTIFLFNPFDETLMKTLVEKILFSRQKNNRNIFVLYASPKHPEPFLEAGFQQVFHIKKVNFIEGIVLQKPASN